MFDKCAYNIGHGFSSTAARPSNARLERREPWRNRGGCHLVHRKMVSRPADLSQCQPGLIEAGLCSLDREHHVLALASLELTLFPERLVSRFPERLCCQNYLCRITQARLPQKAPKQVARRDLVPSHAAGPSRLEKGQGV
jgi:hypothetical protein